MLINFLGVNNKYLLIIRFMYKICIFCMFIKLLNMWVKKIDVIELIVV